MHFGARDLKPLKVRVPLFLTKRATDAQGEGDCFHPPSDQQRSKLVPQRAISLLLIRVCPRLPVIRPVIRVSEF
jgi:hypothetical protein